MDPERAPARCAPSGTQSSFSSLAAWGRSVALGACLLASPPIASAALNDNFPDRLTLSGLSIQVASDNFGATKEPGEPNHARSLGGASVWWTWTAPATAVYELSTAGSAFDTLLAVYTGTSVTNLTLVAANDDDLTAPNVVTSWLRFPATAGLSYQFAVDGFDGEQGSIRLRLAFLEPPLNDSFANALPLTGSNVTVTGDNTVATREPGEPNHAGKPGGSSVWWQWTAPESAPFELSTAGSSIDTLLAVYTGTLVSNLTQIAANDDASGTQTTSLVRFAARAATHYHVGVDGFDHAQGHIALSLRRLEPPPHDHFTNAAPLSGTVVTTTGNNIGAGAEASEPHHAGRPGGSSVWWRWTAPASDLFDLRTTGSSFNTLLAVYNGTSLSNLTLVAANDNEPGSLQGTSRLQFATSAGTLYHFAVDGADGQQGPITLRLQNTQPPDNDNFAHADLLSGTSVTAIGSNLDATKQPGEPNHVGNRGGASVWWTWTAPAMAVYELSTAGSSFDTLLAVYTGAALTNLALVAANDDPPGTDLFTSQLRFTATSNTSYHFAVDGFLGEQGFISLSLQQTPDLTPNPTFFSRPRRLPDGGISWLLTGPTNLVLRLETSKDLTSWQLLLTTNLSRSPIEILLNPNLIPTRFLRAVY